MFQEELVAPRAGEGLGWGAFMEHTLLFCKH